MLVVGLGVNVECGDCLSVMLLLFLSCLVVEFWYEQKDMLIDFGGYFGYGVVLLLGYLLIVCLVFCLVCQVLMLVVVVLVIVIMLLELLIEMNGVVL